MPKFLLLQMRHIAYTIVSIIALALFSSCTPQTPETLYPLDIKSAECSYEKQTVEIRYTVANTLKDEVISVSASCDAEWVTSVDASQSGVISVSVEEFDGSEGYRTAKIKVKASQYTPAEVTLTQWSKAPETAKHTLMFYFFGTSLSRFFKTNLEDAALAIETGILGNNNRVIFFRQESKNSAYIGELYYDYAEMDCKERRIEEITLSTSIITPEKIGQHIAAMAKYAPAERYGIVFAGHGQGWILREILNNNGKDISASAAALSTEINPWIPAVGAEETRAFGEDNVRVNIPELAEGIERSGVALDYILFDACFMSNIEAIYDLRNSANYIIASPCEIMGKGFPYHRTLPYLFNEYGTTTDYEGAAESYYKYYRDEYVGSSRCGSVTLYDCSQVESLAEATKEVMESATDEYNDKELQTYEGQTPHHFYDFGQWVRVVATDEDALAHFNEAFDSAIIATFTLSSFYSAYGTYGTYPINLDVYTGVTTSAPSKAYPYGWKQTNWYNDVIKLEN